MPGLSWEPPPQALSLKCPVGSDALPWALGPAYDLCAVKFDRMATYEMGEVSLKAL
eukprot:CAMPEP_0180281606 /NCGR_PEP_ID=MMETSP0988-20121125/9305_1 /TAXON_ID=697907 /ORGANISM="non described non described, Strain CCMP2293" /LENGTH=55 /DNA_ID=CAMNT_0022253629 /DNA_START=148 /DNA_END=313 /DNA_ORIENTATION=-